MRELKRQFNASLYERLALSRDKKGIRKLAREGQAIARPQDLLKEPFVLEFLLCKQRNKALVEITLPKGANIHAREYQLYLPGKEELRRKLIEWTSQQGVGDE